MARLSQSIEIPAAPMAVYDYVSRPARWREWQLASLGAHELGVQELSKDSLVAGRRFEGEVRSSGRSYHLTWLVEESRPGQYWRASAYMADGSTVKLFYEFRAVAGGTHFTRTLDYVFEPVLLRWMDRFFLRKKVERESLLALENLRNHFAS
ncbi:MAG: SRPBCC family protein [bacterium]|nr:SRPBCC family protein [bacterium]